MAVTRKSVLTECLEYERELWKVTSKKYDTLEPAHGMEAQWEEQKEKCRILQELIQALESEPVRRELAEWQKEIITGNIVDYTKLIEEQADGYQAENRDDRPERE